MILLIDNYDSFVFNVEQYIKNITEEEVRTIRNDEITIDEIEKMNVSKIVLSPGPKHPKDSNICLEIIEKVNLPILGICLGHQAIGYVYGAEIKKLEKPLHGKISEIRIDNKSKIFENLPEKIEVMRYHSLYVDEENLSKDLEILAKTEDNIIMALKHREKEIYGIQFHPESFYTNNGQKIIENFIKN